MKKGTCHRPVICEGQKSLRQSSAVAQPRAQTEQRSSNYWAFYNYIRAEKKFRCNETLTYTTHGEYTFLHNLEPLLKRWQV